MTPQFTTPCYVQVDDPKKRKEVCDKLEQMGYSLLPPPCTEDYRFSIRLNFAYLYVESRCSVPIYDLSNHKPSYIPVIDCGTNIPLFLVLAGMRSDTDRYQWFVFVDDIFEAVRDENGVDTGNRYKNHSKGEFVYCTYNDINLSNVRKATAAEIIEHFKQKGEKK